MSETKTERKGRRGAKAPGTPASEPEDRNLFDADALTEEEVDAAVAQAQLILDGEQPAVPDSEPEPDDLDALLAEVEQDTLSAEITGLLETIQEVIPKHARLALLANQRGLSNDFNTLSMAARHIVRRLNGKTQYLEKA